MARHTGKRRRPEGEDRHSPNRPQRESDGPAAHKAEAVPSSSHNSGSLLRATSLGGRGNAPVQAATLHQMQQTYGNRAVQRFLNRPSSGAPAPTIQRHPKGSASVAATEQAAANPGSLPQMSRNRAATARAAGLPTPMPQRAMEAAKAQEALTGAFGSVKAIAASPVVRVEDRAALHAKMDEISEGSPNPYVEENPPWRKGDAAIYAKFLDGFYHGGTAYVYEYAQSNTATAHEMLHANAAANWKDTAGEIIDEGTTQLLAEDALTQAGITPNSQQTYLGEKLFVREILNIVPRDMLVQAYFNDGALLQQAFDLVVFARSVANGGGMDAITRTFNLHSYSRLKRYIDHAWYAVARDLLQSAANPNHETAPLPTDEKYKQPPAQQGQNTAPVQRAKIPEGAIKSDKLKTFGTVDQNEFMRRVYDAQLKAAAGNPDMEFSAGLPEDQVAEVEGGKMLHKTAAKDAKALLASARSALATAKAAKDKHAKKVSRIGIASAYRSLRQDFSAWRKAFATRYAKTQSDRAAMEGGEHGKKAFELVLSGMKKYKASPGFSNHSKGMAIDFTTTERGTTLSAKGSHSEGWQKSWLYAWLKANAGNHNFQPLSTEEWHWDYNMWEVMGIGISVEELSSAYKWASIGSGLTSLLGGSPGLSTGAGLMGAASSMLSNLFSAEDEKASKG